MTPGLRKWLVRGATCALGGGVMLGVWGTLIEPRLVQTRRIQAHLPNLPHGWEGRQVALLGDLQVGAPMANTDAIRRAIEAVVRSRPAVVLLTGDFVYNLAHDPSVILSQTLELLRPLVTAEIPCFGVLGNHDFAQESTPEHSRQRELASEVVAGLETAGIRVLRNESAAVRAPGMTSTEPPLYVVGLGEYSARECEWESALAGVPDKAARIVLAHDPRALEPIPAGAAPLGLAGHTHGGQIRVPFTRAWTPARWWMHWPEYVDGWISGFLRPGNRLYVNRGLGFSKIPVRIGAPPELTLVTLHRLGSAESRHRARS
jgi:predicted MPP superfamily phosphohydrolase